MRVLIVEDEPNLGRQLRSTLEGAGYAVDLATDGEDGDYLGPEFNGDTYRLKFMHDGRVIWVDVDAQTGRIVGRSNPGPARR